MFIKSRLISNVYRAILVCLCFYGVMLNLGDFSTTGEMLSYYTIDSNVLVLVFFALLLVRNLLKSQPPNAKLFFTVKGGVTTAILLTFLVYHFVLAPSLAADSEFLYSPANIITHYVVPLMALFDWLLFDPKGRFGKLDPLWWTVVPLGYLGFILVRAQFASFSLTGSRFPYFFIDIDKYGIGQVVVNVLVISVGYIGLGYLLRLIDHLLGRKTKNRPPDGRKKNRLQKNDRRR